MTAATFMAAVITQARQLKQRAELQVWLAQYALAESRDAHIAFNRHLRAAACCMGLAALSLCKTGGAQQ